MNGFTLNKRAIAVLNLPRTVNGVIIAAKTIGIAMEGSSYFAASAAKITQLNTDIQALENVEMACHTRPPVASVEARNVVVVKVKDDLRSLRLDVQEVADNDIENAEVIIVSAGMKVKRGATHSKQQNTADDGIEEGSIDLTGAGKGPHEWRISTDEKEWTLLPSSMISKTTVEDLTPGMVYYFQNRMMLRNEEKSEWSQSVKLRAR